MPDQVRHDKLSMKLSTNWLKELIPELQLSAKEIAELFTAHSFETVIDREYAIDPNIVVVKIIRLEQHPNADRLRLATVTDGETEVRVVCGAPNISEGDVVPYSPPGANVYDENGKLFTLSVAKIRGVESPGMLNSPRELGVSGEHGGILLLPKDTPLGSKLSEYIPSDIILDADVLPDRAQDMLAHSDVAKELSAITRLACKEQPATPMQQILQGASGIAPFVREQSGRISGNVRSIAFHPDRPSRMAGIEISREEVRDILQRLQFTVIPAPEPESRSMWMPDQARHDNLWQVTPPQDRLDILGEHDIVDEVIRMIGYDRIPASQHASHTHPLPVSDTVYWQQQIREKLVALGFTETYSYSFEDERFARLVNAEIHPHVELTNPMAPELKKLRYSMLPGLIGAMITSRDEMHRNKQGIERALFEIGRVYHVGDAGVVPGVVERTVVAGIAVGNEDVLQQVFDNIFELFKIEGVETLPLTKGELEGVNMSFAKKIRLQYAGEFLAIGYVCNAELLKKMKYRMPVVAFEISFGALMKHAPDVEIPTHTLEEVRAMFTTPRQFTELPKFPSVFRDISILVASDTGIDAVESAINQVGGQLVVDVDLFDEYEAPASASGKHQVLTEKTPGVEEARTKSLAFHIEYRSPDRTLTDKEIAEVHKKIEHAIKNEFSAEVR